MNIFDEFEDLTNKKYLNPRIVGSINSGVQNHVIIVINDKEAKELTEIESELIRVCKTLSIKDKYNILSYAYKIKEKGE